MTRMLQFLGFLRLALIGFTLLNALPAILVQLVPAVADIGEGSLWAVLVRYVAPVMAPLFLVVIFFDYIMSRIQAADAEGDAALRFAAIARIELGVMLLTLLIWVPFFVTLMR